MKTINTILVLIASLMFNGCYSKIPSYEAFEFNNNWNIGKSHIPRLNPNLREVYSEDKYI